MNKLYKSLLLLSTLSPVLIASSYLNKKIEKPIENVKNDKKNMFKEVKDTALFEQPFQLI